MGPIGCKGGGAVTMVDHASGCGVYTGAPVCTCGAIARVAADIHSSAFIHPKAHVQGARVGARTKIWQFASVTAGTVIGEDCSIWPHALLDGPAIGDRCKIASSVAMGPGFQVGNDVFIGPSVTFCNDLWPRTDATGWDVSKLRDGSCVAVIVESGASIGAGAVILPGVRIGAGAMIAAGAVCGIDVPSGCLFRRDGRVVEIDPKWIERRMRAAR